MRKYGECQDYRVETMRGSSNNDIFAFKYTLLMEIAEDGRKRNE